MKNKSFLLLTGLLSGIILASCSSPSIKDTIEVYKDNSVAKIDDLLVKVDHIDASQNYSSVLKGYKSKIYLRFTNDGASEQKINLRDSLITSENDNTTHESGVKIAKDTLGGNEIAFVSYEASTPTPLEENKYSLSTVINDVKYLVHLYAQPDSGRKDFTVNYQIGDKVVNSVKIKENKPLGVDYVYENPNHLSYCGIWSNKDGQAVGSNTRIISDLTLTGVEKNNISYTLNGSDEYVATTLEYIPSDKVAVVPSTFDGKNMTEIGNSFFFSKQVKIIYLPSTITKIEENNFFRCTILKTINYAGTEAEWNAINNLSAGNIPAGVTINFETTFAA